MTEIVVRASRTQGRDAVIAWLVEQGYKVSLQPRKVNGRNMTHLVLEDMLVKKEDKESE